MTDDHLDQIDELDALIDLVKSTAGASAAYLDRFPGDATAANADRLIAQAIAGFHRAKERVRERAERATAKAIRFAGDTEERKYDDLTKQLADQRGISYAEMQAIRDEAAARARQAASRGSLEEQLAAAPEATP